MVEDVNHAKKGVKMGKLKLFKFPNKVDRWTVNSKLRISRKRLLKNVGWIKWQNHYL